MIHNHEVRSSILRPATKLEALAFFRECFFRICPVPGKYAELHTSLFLAGRRFGIKIVSIPVHVLKLILDSHWGMFDFLDRLPWKNLELRLSSGQRHIDFCNSLIYKEL